MTLYNRGIIALLFTFSVASAHATVINFDDIDASLGDVSLDAISPYQGLTWTNFFAYTSFPGFDGFNNGIVSGLNGAYTGGASLNAPVAGKIESASLFDLKSINLGAAYYDGLVITVEGLRAGALVASRVVTVDTTGAILTNFNFSNIDEVDLYATTTADTSDPFFCGGSDNCTQLTLDNLTLAQASTVTPPPNTAPEPSILALLGLAAVSLGVVRRKRTSRVA